MSINNQGLMCIFFISSSYDDLYQKSNLQKFPINKPSISSTFNPNQNSQNSFF
ncbi:hypothetical protein MKW98_010504, partial [Papaver atlanticum]